MSRSATPPIEPLRLLDLPPLENEAAPLPVGDRRRLAGTRPMHGCRFTKGSRIRHPIGTETDRLGCRDRQRIWTKPELSALHPQAEVEAGWHRPTPEHWQNCQFDNLQR